MRGAIAVPAILSLLGALSPPRGEPAIRSTLVVVLPSAPDKCRCESLQEVTEVGATGTCQSEGSPPEPCFRFIKNQNLTHFQHGRCQGAGEVCQLIAKVCKFNGWKIEIFAADCAGLVVGGCLSTGSGTITIDGIAQGGAALMPGGSKEVIVNQTDRACNSADVEVHVKVLNGQNTVYHLLVTFKCNQCLHLNGG